MATCKDCVHHRICNRIDHEIEYSDKSVKEAEEQLAIKCRFFKNNPDFVEVIRCKDCNKAQYKNDRNKTVWCFLHHHERKYDDFCSFGMRCKTE